jgi:small subunit ribosomal protein S5
MTDEQQTKIQGGTSQNATPEKHPRGQGGGRGQRGGGRGGNRRGGGGEGGERRGRARGKTQQVKEYEQKILDLARVTRVTAGGKRMSFRAALVIGDKKGRVGFGVAKGSDVQIAVEKAYRQAKKNVITVPMQNETIPYAVKVKEGSAIVLLKPAPKGTGLKSGGAVRMIMEYAGVPNVVSRVLNSSNKINIAHATFAAIKQLGFFAAKE